jgi:uncharacterized membrane protein YdjX (TVP38/TMEM64 family)
LTVIGATLGATLLFLIARSAAGVFLCQRAGPFLARMAEGFSKDALKYLLFLRLVPAFPFWAVNLAPALLGMRLVPFAISTALGIIPGTVVYTAFGTSLGQVFDAGDQVDIKAVFSPTLIAALIGLGLFALLPVVLKRLWEQRALRFRSPCQPPTLKRRFRLRKPRLTAPIGDRFGRRVARRNAGNRKPSWGCYVLTRTSMF